MLSEKDYCDYNTCVELKELGFDDLTDFYFKEDKTYVSATAYCRPDLVPRISLYEAQQWLMTQGIHIAPRIYLYHDICLDEETSWECNIYIEYSAIYNIGKSLTYQDAMLAGIKDAIRVMKNAPKNIEE